MFVCSSGYPLSRLDRHGDVLRFRWATVEVQHSDLWVFILRSNTVSVSVESGKAGRGHNAHISKRLAGVPGPVYVGTYNVIGQSLSAPQGGHHNLLSEVYYGGL